MNDPVLLRSCASNRSREGCAFFLVGEEKFGAQDVDAIWSGDTQPYATKFGFEHPNTDILANHNLLVDSSREH
jgi:hypothetical protein